jgi:hypothetical protein
MKQLIALILLVSGSLSFAGSNKDFKLKPWDPKYFTIDAGDRIKVAEYIESLGIYHVITVNDPTVLKIYATPKSLEDAIPSLNPNVVKANPKSIVGHEYDLQKDLVIESEE